MKIEFELGPEPEGWREKAAQEHPYDLHCPGCGRYCKSLGVTPHYNGWFDLLTQTTNCKKCGVIDIELV